MSSSESPERPVINLSGSSSSPASPPDSETPNSSRKRRRRRAKSDRGESEKTPSSQAGNQGRAKPSGQNGQSAPRKSSGERKRKKQKNSPGKPKDDYQGTSYFDESEEDHGVGDFDLALASEEFRSLGLAPELLRAVHHMGYISTTPVQADAIPVALQGRDIIGCAQTGTGKTAAFVLPTLQRIRGGTGTRALALTPTRELAVQVAEHFHALSRYLPLRTAVIYGGVDYEPQIRALHEKVDILVATPGRLLDHMRRRTAKLTDLEVLILDEADRMLDMGFADEIKDILKRLPKNRQTMLFSATMQPTLKFLAQAALAEPVSISITPPSTPAEGIFHAVYPLSYSNKLRAVLEIHLQIDATTVLIFTRTKAGADQLSDAMERQNISVARLHSDRSQRQREKALNDFKGGRHSVLVATDIASRGLDVSGITHVINFDVPEYPEDYVHRAGRTARAGKIGYAFTLMSPGEISLVQNIERFIGKALPRANLPGLSDDLHQKGLTGEPLPLKDQPPVTRYNRRGRSMPRRTGLALR